MARHVTSWPPGILLLETAEPPLFRWQHGRTHWPFRARHWPVARRNDLNAANTGIGVWCACPGRKVDDDCAGVVCTGCEHFFRRPEKRTRLRENIVVGQDRNSVNGNIEKALTDPLECGFGKVQTHRVAASGGQIGNDIS